MNKTALITGASRGIGRAIAKELAKEGYNLYIIGRRRGDLLALLKLQLEELYGIHVEAFVGDVADYSFLERVFSQLPSLHVLVNNAGISHVGLLHEMEISDWHTLLNTNLTAAFYTGKLAVPIMLKQGFGNIINISSVWGTVGASMEVAYSVSKGGLNSLTKALAKELAPSNIQVNAIACGLIDTEINQVFSKEDLSLVIEEIPADRMGTPEEVGQLVRQIVSAPTYLTGQIIALDGGWI